MESFAEGLRDREGEREETPFRRSLLAAATVVAPERFDFVELVEAWSAAGEATFFWERPQDEVSIVGLGQVLAIEASGPSRFSIVEARCREVVADLHLVGATESLPIFLGGFSFRPRGETEVWSGFPDASLIVPRLCLVRRGNTTWVRRFSVLEGRGGERNPESGLREDLERLRALSCRRKAGVGPRPTPVPVAVQPSDDDWRRILRESLGRIRGGELEKLVLARACAVRADVPFELRSIVRGLLDRQPACTTFWISRGGRHFVGATPERLAAVVGGEVRTAALAGTAPRGQRDAADRALGHGLRESPKERREHGIVVEAIRAALAPICSSLDVPAEPEVLGLRNVQHLHSPITGRLREPRGVLDLVARLHPTPAVGGHPGPNAVSALVSWEAFDRGWYAGPVGWVDADLEGEFVVALRSAVVRGTEATLFAGAGIVEGSDAEAELAETELKLAAMRAALVGA